MAKCGLGGKISVKTAFSGQQQHPCVHGCRCMEGPRKWVVKGVCLPATCPVKQGGVVSMRVWADGLMGGWAFPSGSKWVAA